jgi:hypothetical protein
MMDKMDEACSTYREKKSTVFDGETRKRPLGRPRLRWKGNIKMFNKEIGC